MSKSPVMEPNVFRVWIGTCVDYIGVIRVLLTAKRSNMCPLRVDALEFDRYTRCAHKAVGRRH
jgi:hypothetical protein